MSTQQDVLAYGPVHLEVTDVPRSAAFYQEVLGLVPVPRDGTGTALGTGEVPLVVLHRGARYPKRPGHSGLYHLALHVSTAGDFAGAITRIARHAWPQAPTDHITHWATYLDDPDGIQVEVAFETIERVVRYEAGPGWPVIIDRDGRSRHAVEPLDMEHVMGHAREGAHYSPMADGTVVGHLHLHVRALDEGQAFLCDVVGMRPNVAAPAIGFADLSLGGGFPHRMAINTWQRPGTPHPEGTAGMRHAELLWHDEDLHDAALARLERAGALDGESEGQPRAVDPSGTAFAVAVAGTAA